MSQLLVRTQLKRHIFLVMDQFTSYNVLSQYYLYIQETKLSKQNTFICSVLWHIPKHLQLLIIQFSTSTAIRLKWMQVDSVTLLIPIQIVVIGRRTN